MLDNTSRITHCHHIRRDVADHHTTRSYRHIVANGDTGKNSSTTTNPHTMANGDWFCPFTTCVTLLRIGTVTSGIDANIGTDKTVVAYGYWCFVEHSPIEIGKETLTTCIFVP